VALIDAGPSGTSLGHSFPATVGFDAGTVATTKASAACITDPTTNADAGAAPGTTSTNI